MVNPHKSSLGSKPDDVVASLKLLADKLNKYSPEDSIVALEAITLLTNNCIDTQKKIAQYYYNCQKWENAISHLERCCEVDDMDFVSYFYLANCYKNLGNYKDAITYYERSLEIQEYPEGLVNLSSVYFDLKNRELELQVLEKLVSSFPEYTLGHYNLGIYWYGMKNMQMSIYNYRCALNSNPDHGETKIALSLALLMDKQYTEGFALYESRWGVWPNCPIRDFNRPYWKGEDVSPDNSILITVEQGFGDTIMMLRYMSLLIKKFRIVYIEAKQPLQRLISLAFPKAVVVFHGNSLPVSDWFCPIMSLPHAFNVNGKLILPSRPYISIDVAEPFEFGLQNQTKKRIGICWRCGGNDPRTAHRSIKLSSIEKIFDCEDFLWISLTKDVSEDDHQILDRNSRILNFMDITTDFYDTYRLIKNLDIVVTVDTAIAHLAGAMGKPTVIILNEAADWKWGVDCESSDWYPSASLLRFCDFENTENIARKILEKIDEALS